jgi:hypothetical protein
VITVQTGVNVSALTAANIEQIANLNVQFADEAAVRSVVVTGPNSPTGYGLARMFEAYADSQKNATVAVFETLDEAMVWINEEDAPRPPEPSVDGPQASP